MATPTALSQLKGQGRVTKRPKILEMCKDYYKISTDMYQDSINEGKEVIDLYHNRQYTAAQLEAIRRNGQPAETFNVIRMMVNAIIGYLETVVVEPEVQPRYPAESIRANIMNDTLQYTLDENDWSTIQKFMKIDGLLTGLMCVYEEVIPTGEKDELGRPLYAIQLNHIPSYQVRIDPQSKLENYSDARFIHHFTWMPEETVKKLWPRKAEELVEYYNYLEDGEADWGREYPNHEIGKYKYHNNYLITKTILAYKGDIWSVVWCDETILEKKKITYKDTRFPYRVVKMSHSDRAEYYGPFRDVVETQKAINQALLQIQLLVNTSKAFVEDGAVEDIEEFRELFNRVNAVIPVNSLQGIQIEDMSRDIMQQYAIIDQALARIKMVLGINDSFLGQAYASDSGRKVQLQQMASSSQLTMIVDRVAAMIKFVGEDIVGLIKQYYVGHQILKISDPLNVYHYTEINTPLMQPTGIDPQTGMPIMQPVMVPEMDPETGDPMFDDDGNMVMIPLNDPNSDVSFAEVELKVVSTRAENANERNQLFLETFLNGPAGQILLQTNPAAYLKSAAMQVSEMGTKHSIEIAKMLIETAIGIEQGTIDPRLAMFGGDVQAIMGGAMGGNTGNAVNAGRQAGNSMGVPKIGREGGSPGGAQ